MPPRLPPPPPYDEDAAELARMLEDLNLVDRRPRYATPPRLTPIYSVQTPSTSGVTDSWSEAAAATQGVPGASPRRLHPKSRKKAKSKAYVVFFGVVPGAYRLWYEEVAPLVLGVPGSIYHGYPSVPQAVAAFEYARARGWTRAVPSRSSCVVLSTSTTAIPRLPAPARPTDDPNPLHTELDGRWYVVYCGITPGVYQSSLNIVGLSCVAHESFSTQEEAFSSFQDAVEAGTVKVVNPKYVR
ncbi:hypothetical protein C8R47DRAFT_1062603 [Mycena vitilis]|nr:hypothetical protein C8R47DRAFT_1062603 [Mycena vitilis]